MRIREVTTESFLYWQEGAGIIENFVVVERNIATKYSKQCPYDSDGYELVRAEYDILEKRRYHKREYHPGDEGYENQGYENEFEIIDHSPIPPQIHPHVIIREKTNSIKQLFGG